jgi:hypothetical protein
MSGISPSVDHSVGDSPHADFFSGKLGSPGCEITVELDQPTSRERADVGTPRDETAAEREKASQDLCKRRTDARIGARQSVSDLPPEEIGHPPLTLLAIDFRRRFLLRFEATKPFALLPLGAFHDRSGVSNRDHHDAVCAPFRGHARVLLRRLLFSFPDLLPTVLREVVNEFREGVVGCPVRYLDEEVNRAERCPLFAQ